MTVPKRRTPHSHRYANFRRFFQAVGGKSKQIRTMLKMHQFDPGWTVPSKLDNNPMVWMVEVNGFAMDIRDPPP